MATKITDADIILQKAAVSRARQAVKAITSYIGACTNVWSNFSSAYFSDAGTTIDANEKVTMGHLGGDLLSGKLAVVVTGDKITLSYGLDALRKSGTGIHAQNNANLPKSEKYGFTLTNLSAALGNAQTDLKNQQDALTKLQNNQTTQATKDYNNSKQGKKDAAALKKAQEAAKVFNGDANPTQYNVSAVKEAYFKDRPAPADINGNAQPVFWSWNAPSGVESAKQLWVSSLSNKGMFEAYQPPGGWSDGQAKTSGGAGIPNKQNQLRYGFQFLYNPTTLSLNYMGVAQTDVAYQMSGNDKVNYIQSADATGSISFSIPLNRMFDMKYYNSEGQCTDTSQYIYRVPWGANYYPEGLFDEQKAIYNKGTMYDVEYLLRTLIGFTVKSELRGSQWTADMGLFARRPVNLHLGPEMRYRGYVSALSVNHVMFNERMVPIMSSLNITFNRYPDYPSTNGSTSSSTTTSTN